MLMFKVKTMVLVFVKDASLYFINCGHGRRKREIVIQVRSTRPSEGAIYKTGPWWKATMVYDNQTW